MTWKSWKHSRNVNISIWPRIVKDAMFSCPIRTMCFRWHRWISKTSGSTLQANSDSLHKKDRIKTVDELQCSAICPPFVVYGIGSASFPPIHSTLTLLSFKPTLSDTPMSGMLTPPCRMCRHPQAEIFIKKVFLYGQKDRCPLLPTNRN